MASVKFANAVAGTLTAAISSAQLTMTVNPVPFSSVFPTLVPGDWYYLTIVDQYSYQSGINPPQQREIVKVTAFAGFGAMTIVRGQEGTTQYAWSIGDRVELRLTNQGILDSLGTGSASGAATYLTLTNDPSLTQNRGFVPGNLLSAVDLGAQSIYTLKVADLVASGLLGNNTGGGTASALSVAQVNTLLGTLTAAGGVTSINIGTDAGKGVFGTVGKVWISTDTGVIYRDTGAAWVIVTPAFTGDVTKPVASLATTIANSAVTNAKMANMAANTVKGVIGGGAPTDLSQTQLTSLVNTFTAGLSGAAPSSTGTTTDFLRADGTWNPPSGSQGQNTPYNLIINGGMNVNQRFGTGGGVALSTAAQYACDRWTCWFSSGSAVSGTGRQFSTPAAVGVIGRTLCVLQASALGATGTSVISFRTRIESVDATRLRNATAGFSCVVIQSTGASQTGTVIIRKPTATDNYAGTSVISTSSPVTLNNNTSTPVTMSGVSMGDCSTGIEIEVQISLGVTPVGAGVQITECVLAEGAGIPLFPYLEFDDELSRCKRYYQKSFPYTTLPAQNAGITGAVSFNAAVAGANPERFSVAYEKATRFSGTPTLTTYNPSAANAQARDVTQAVDTSAMTITTSGESGITAGLVTGNVLTLAGDQISFHYTIDVDL